MGKYLLNLLPVDDLPYLLEEGWPHVLVVEVVGVHPNINGQQCVQVGVS